MMWSRIIGVLAVAFAGLAGTTTSSMAGSWLGGEAAPSSVKRALTVRLGESTAQERSLVGSVIPGRAIVGASLDATHFVWAAPTDKGS